ncbi:mannitol-specific phosphotransferase system IIBC component [Mycoplasmoides fastidiosum]|uniref:PTS system mannitol-specific EIICB component n=1 Tax=Mycoplasmoides fastidiosum TaxID=92758 RepID=A0ABU0LZ85_9BACT|nr:PTS transporter subunit EIIC [Mycoplasmoides fastidiosum]MDQ0513913.1 mannitol-specific phosphotransferase system IIBC component [Mycoplasmoides fastidiosum]UUD37673.1 hypothetical protein NPA10_03840 [Mycoplasmoides fastidiosum]
MNNNNFAVTTEMNKTRSQVNPKRFGDLFKPKTIKNQIRKFGSFLAGMIMPAIGVFIAWGLITAFFLKTGWTPNEQLAIIIGPTLSYVIPVLIAFFGGKQIYGTRGAMIGIIATLGVLYSSSTHYFANIAGIPIDPVTNQPVTTMPMLLGAMIAAPIAAIVFKKLERFWKPYIPQGYEMLINNFSLGIFGFGFAIIAFYGLTPIIAGIQCVFSQAINGMYQNQLDWLLPIFVEPAKVLFLNNAVNHGIFTPLGTAEVQTAGKSFLLLLDPNPGQGLGILIAWWLFAKSNSLKAQAASSMPIHFVGGIHEVYFPFVLMKPVTLIFMIIGGIFNIIIYNIFGVGSISVNSPGSVISVYTFLYQSSSSYIGLTISILGSAGIVGGLTAFYLIWERNKNGERVFINPYYSWINSRHYKIKNQPNLFELNRVKKLQSLTFQTISGKKQLLLETLILENGNQELFYLNPKSAKMLEFQYVDYKQNTYLVKVFATKNKFWVTKINYLKSHFFSKKFHTFTKALTHFDSTKIMKFSKVETEDLANKIVDFNYQSATNDRYFCTYSFVKNNKTITKKQEVQQTDIHLTLADLRQETQIQQTQFAVNDDLVSALKSVKQIVFACEAGMGSSAMGASLVRKLLKNNNITHIDIINKPLKNLAAQDQLVITQENFKSFVETKNPNAYVYTIKQFLDKKGYDQLVSTATKVFNN